MNEVYSKPGKNKTVTEYEQNLRREIRQANGVYYTPADIIGYILAHTVERVDVKLNPFVRVLDPACGCGLFLLAAYDILKRKFTENLSTLRSQTAGEHYELIDSGGTRTVTGEQYWRSGNLHQHLLRYCLFGADSDPAAIALAAEALSAKSTDLFSTMNLIVCDSLIKWEAGQPGNPETVFWSKSFDCIIGNPPYIPVTRMHPEQKEYYRRHYATAHGRLNTFVLFLERSLEKASDRVGMIVPSRLLLNTQYGAIRRLIFQRSRLERVLEACEGIFAGATVDTVVVILQPGQSNITEKIVIERRNREQAGVELVDPASMPVRSGGLFSVAAGNAELTAVTALERRSQPLNNLAEIRDGIIQGAVGAELFLGRNPRPGSCCKPVLFGQRIKPYECNWQGEYIWYDPPWLTQLEDCRTAGRGRGLRLRTPAIFERPKILSRQTADHIIAAMDTHGYYYMNTLHGVTVTSPEFDPWYVLAVMNSEIIRCWYAWRFAETGRSFAQVKIANLRQLPVPCPDPEIRNQVAQLAAAASRECQNGKNADRLLETVNDMLYNHCSLDAHIIDTMKLFARKLNKPKTGR